MSLLLLTTNAADAALHQMQYSRMHPLVDRLLSLHARLFLLPEACLQRRGLWNLQSSKHGQ